MIHNNFYHNNFSLHKFIIISLFLGLLLGVYSRNNATKTSIWAGTHAQHITCARAHAVTHTHRSLPYIETLSGIKSTFSEYNELSEMPRERARSWEMARLLTRRSNRACSPRRRRQYAADRPDGLIPGRAGCRKTIVSVLLITWTLYNTRQR